MAAVRGLIIGVVLGVFVKPDIPIILQPYLPIMVVAALDALLGAARAYFERSFSDKVFVISFISNVVTATLLVFLGNQLAARIPAADGRHRRAGNPYLLERVGDPSLHLPGVMNHGGAQIVS